MRAGGRMHQQLQEMLTDFAARGSSMFLSKRRQEPSPEEAAAKVDGRLFSKLVLAIALRGLNFPLSIRGEEQAYTEGGGDRGLDGPAIAVGRRMLTSVLDIDRAVNASDGQQPKILFIQSKLLDEAKGQHIGMNEIDLFGKNVLNFITTEWEIFRKAETNGRVARQHRIYHGLKSAYEAAGLPWQPVVYLLFGVSRPYKDYAGPNSAHEANAHQVQGWLPKARISTIIWGDEELLAQAQKVGIRITTKLPSGGIAPIPAGSAAAAYLGVIPAEALIDAFCGDVAGQAQLLERYFSDNPRARLEVTETSSPGAFGIRRALRKGEGSDIVLGHNGVVIMARSANVSKGLIELTAAQVVNGYQSCHAFFDMRHKLKNVVVPLKIIVTEKESVRDNVIIASNSQALIDGFDILACRSEVRALQEEFHQVPWREPQRLWLQRRRNEPLDYPDGNTDIDRTLRPKELVNAYAAALSAHPHTVHGDGRWALSKALRGEIFVEAHDPLVYQALGWLVVAGRRWGRRQKLDWHLDGGEGSYAARHQFVHALWRIADDTPDKTQFDDLRLSGPVKARFQKVIERLLGPHADTLAGWAAEAVSAGNAVSAPNLKAFTEAATRKADDLRAKRQSLKV